MGEEGPWGIEGLQGLRETFSDILTACKSKCESTSEEEEEEDPEWLQRGRKMLEKMGWEHGKGLGKHKQVKLRYVACFLLLTSP